MEKKPHIQIPRVRLGSQGLEVSRLGFGCGRLSGILNAPLSHEAGCSVIKETFQRGITFFDTADIYGDHHNEIMVGKALKQLGREKIQLATKFGFTKVEEGQFGVKGTPEYVRQCCEASLKELGIGIVAYSPLGHGFFGGKAVVESLPNESMLGQLKNLDNNIGSLVVKLTQEDLKEICDAVPINEVGGERFPATLSKYAWKVANTPSK
nr:putative aldo-keto reductase 1 [Quercus suber]